MSNTMYPCLWFDGNAEEAAKFYCGILKDSTVKVCTPMVVTFELCGKQFMGLNGGPMFQPNPSISFFVKCTSIDETNEVWGKLIEGGSALIPIDKQPWNKRYGWVKDKFGFTWQVMVSDRENDKQTICPAMLFTQNKFGKAEEAVKLYTSLFKNSNIDVLIPYPDGDANAGKVMFSEFKLNGYNIVAMDGPGEHTYTFNEAVSLVVNCDTQEEIDHYWGKFTANGGQESQCGWLKDKWGVSWQIVPAVLGKLMTGPNAQKVMQAFMKMKKFIIADLEKAAS
ncbi:MAG TPA: VOC family protein [Chitinophagaceae bacterium]|nr:VOC family protein [Chitinophagaceae bacterium]